VVDSGKKWRKVVITMFMGEYHYSIDDKGRITVPAKFRYELGENFIVTRGLDNCLFIYPKHEWNNIITKYRELPNTKNARDFMRFFLSGATECEFDRQGRINVSTPLMKYADLNKECVIIGVNDRLEVWSKDRWTNFIETNEENLSDIADSLFSSQL
jgi:MraZ protein